jgi:predicted GIY-YIG superfamily endonuclease
LLDITDEDINAIKHKFLISTENESGYVGVYFDKKKRVWHAKHNDGKGNRAIGSFETKEIAALAYYRCTEQKRKMYGLPEGKEKWWV